MVHVSCRAGSLTGTLTREEVASSFRQLAFTFMFMASETADLEHASYRAAIVEEFTFADAESDCWLVSTSTVAVRMEVARNGHRPDRDVRRMRRRCGARCRSDLAGSKTSEAERLAGVQLDVTMLVISRDQGHQDLTCDCSGCVDRLRSACNERLASQTCRRASCEQAQHRS